MNNKYKPKSARISLDSVYSEYRKISDAPTYADLQYEADKFGFDIEEVVERERQNLYKSQNIWGEVFLIQNPAVWKEERRNGMVFRIRPTPQLVHQNGKHTGDPVAANNDPVAPNAEQGRKVVGGFF